MSPQKFHKKLSQCGFVLCKGHCYTSSHQVKAICKAETSKRTGYASINLGFWIFSLGGVEPNEYYKCHIYGPLRFIFIEFSDLRIFSFPSDHDGWSQSIDRAPFIANEIKKCLQEEHLIHLYNTGSFEKCLIRKEARLFMDNQ